MYQTDNSRQVEVARLEDYLQAFGQRKWLVAAFAIFGLVLAFLYTGAAATTFTATSEIQLRPTPVGSPTNNLVTPRLEEESRVLGSDAVAAQVAATYPAVDREELDITFTPNSSILVASYTAPTAEEAALIVNEFATVYADQRTAAAIEYYQVQIEANETALTAIDENITTLET
ncbi:MAG: hypothetical protein AAF531_26815, partial [Actinomycetota bacterium]